MVLVIVQSK